MIDALLAELLAARQTRTPCALVTVAATAGSVPRAAGSKMLVYADGKSSGTIGGGKFESLVIADAQESMRSSAVVLKTYRLREGEPDSFGAICGGEATVLIEPQATREAIFLIGGGHCSRAIARTAIDCGLFVTVIDDRAELLTDFPSNAVSISNVQPAAFIRGREWKADEALVIVSRHYEIDREALAAALASPRIGYLGMIGSNRKVHRVCDELKDAPGAEKLASVYAPLGLDIGADSPAEIAVSVVAEVLAVLRKRTGLHLRDR
jgi:xanthine dehydrogenase accessory factor